MGHLKGEGKRAIDMIKSLYAYVQFVNATASLVGSVVKIGTSQGASYKGLLLIISPQRECVLEKAHRIEPNMQKLGSLDVPTNGIIYRLILRTSDIITMSAINTDQDYVAKDVFATDAVISKYNRQHVPDKELEPWDGAQTDCEELLPTLETPENTKGCDVNYMFCTKEQQCRVKSTYDNDTILQVKDNTDKYKEKEVKPSLRSSYGGPPSNMGQLVCSGKSHNHQHVTSQQQPSHKMHANNGTVVAGGQPHHALPPLPHFQQPQQQQTPSSGKPLKPSALIEQAKLVTNELSGSGQSHQLASNNDLQSTISWKIIPQKVARDELKTDINLNFTKSPSYQIPTPPRRPATDTILEQPPSSSLYHHQHIFKPLGPHNILLASMLMSMRAPSVKQWDPHFHPGSIATHMGQGQKHPAPPCWRKNQHVPTSFLHQQWPGTPTNPQAMPTHTLQGHPLYIHKAPSQIDNLVPHTSMALVPDIQSASEPPPLLPPPRWWQL